MHSSKPSPQRSRNSPLRNAPITSRTQDIDTYRENTAIDRKVLVREQGLHARMLDQLGHELLEHVAVLKPVPVLGEDRWVPDRIIWRQTRKPAEEKIVIELLHELTLRTDAVEHLQEKRTH